MFVKFRIRQFVIEWFAFFLSMSMFSIFDRTKFIWTHCSECVSFEVVFSLRDTRTNTAKILFWLERMKSTDFFCSMWSIRFMMKKFALKSVKIDIFTLILSNCIHVISRNRLMQINFKKHLQLFSFENITRTK